MDKEIKIWAIISMILLALNIIFIYHGIELQKKVGFYEMVVEDLGLEEFVDYPNVYYVKD